MPFVKLKANVMLILNMFLDKKKLSKYFLRKTHFNLKIFDLIFEFPANGRRGSGLVLEALSSSSIGHIHPSPFFLSLPGSPWRIRLMLDD
jgi:hypothetical protein